jgi:hypothetical protein
MSEYTNARRVVALEGGIRIRVTTSTKGLNRARTAI